MKIFREDNVLVNIYIDLKLFCRQLGQWMVDVGHFHNTPNLLLKNILLKKLSFGARLCCLSARGNIKCW